MFNYIKVSRNRIIKSFINGHSCDCISRNIHNVGLNDIPKITTTDIRKLLRQKGLAVQDGFTALTTKCSICSGDQKCGESKVYVNKTTGKIVNIT